MYAMAVRSDRARRRLVDLDGGRTPPAAAHTPDRKASSMMGKRSRRGVQALSRHPDDATLVAARGVGLVDR